MINHIIISMLLMLISLTVHAEIPAKCVNKPVKGLIEHLPTGIKASLAKVAKYFCAVQVSNSSQWQTIRVTGTSRGAAEQARYIYSCLEQDECKYYENQQAVREYLAIENLSIDKLKLKIDEQMARNCFISKHLSDRAVDIGTSGMPRIDVDRLVSVFRNHSYVIKDEVYTPSVIDRTHGTGPHLHINFLPYPFDPKLCPE